MSSGRGAGPTLDELDGLDGSRGGRMDVWATVHAERAALISDLEGVEDGRWETASLCPGWTVHDVVAHLVDTARTTRIGFVLGLARARFDFDRQNDAGIARYRGTTPGETLAGLRAVVGATATPPAPLDSRLVEAIVHGEDVRRPLGLTGSYPPEALERALRLQVRTPVGFGGGKERVEGLRLRATDADVVIGDGPEVTGSLLALLMGVCGRPPVPGNLEGPPFVDPG